MRVWRLALVACVLLLPVAAVHAQGASEGEAWYDKITVNGFAQARYEARDASGSVDDFHLPRFYMNFIADVTDRANVVITYGRVGPGNPSVDICNAFVDWQISDEWTARVGQVPTNFGYDVWESSSKRLPFERWAAGAGLPGLPGIYFAGPWDRGIYLMRTPSGNEPKVIVGVVNGNFRNPDDNNNKTVSADLRWKRDWGEFGISWMDGKYGNTPQDREAINLYIHTEPAPWGFQAEYLDGSMGPDIDGWYLQVAHNVNKATPFVRYEVYDPDKDVGGDFSGLHIGCAYQLDSHNELTVEYLDAEMTYPSKPAFSGPCGGDYGQIGIQWQYAF